MDRRVTFILAAADKVTLCVMVVIGITTAVGCADSHNNGEGQYVAHLASTAKGETASAAETKYSVTIRKPKGLPQIELAGVDPQGRSASVACSTCHAQRRPNFDNVSATTLDEFHRGMSYNHGKIACYACHNPYGSDTLRLADGSAVAFSDVMTLCSQCHGPQATAFAHGAHGGMNGYWDLSRGPQTKNNCIDCHDPHAPAYPKMVVDFKPKDRFNAPSQTDHTEGH